MGERGSEDEQKMVTDQPPAPRLANLAQLRASMAAYGKALQAPSVLTSDHAAHGVPVRLYRAPQGTRQEAESQPLLIFLHGGGWVLGDLETHDACCRWLCTVAHCAVLAVGYRLAPEHPFPAALDDAHVALAWATANAHALGCDPERIAIGGESAGANLAAALMLRLREEGAAQPIFQLLVHPATDLLLQQPSIKDVTIPGLDLHFLNECIEGYAGGTSRENPFLSPLRAADLTGLAPAIVVTVEQDPLRDDGEFYALALARAGNAASVQRLPGLPHGFMCLPATEPGIADAYRLLGDRIARHFKP